MSKLRSLANVDLILWKFYPGERITEFLYDGGKLLEAVDDFWGHVFNHGGQDLLGSLLLDIEEAETLLFWWKYGDLKVSSKLRRRIRELKEVEALCLYCVENPQLYQEIHDWTATHEEVANAEPYIAVALRGGSNVR